MPESVRAVYNVYGQRIDGVQDKSSLPLCLRQVRRHRDSEAKTVFPRSWLLRNGQD